jgi:hypothetical protein
MLVQCEDEAAEIQHSNQDWMTYLTEGIGIDAKIFRLLGDDKDDIQDDINRWDDRGDDLPPDNTDSKFPYNLNLVNATYCMEVEIPDCSASSVDISRGYCRCQGQSCFGSSAKVELESGFISVNEISEGDRVKTLAGFEPVLGFLHKSTANVEFLAIEHEQGTIELSPGHYLYAADGSIVMARDVNVGDRLSTATSPITVISIKTVSVKGFVAPLTPSGTIIVDGVAASVYASSDTIIPEWMSHIALAPFRLMHNLGFTFSQPDRNVRLVPAFTS